MYFATSPGNPSSVAFAITESSFLSLTCIFCAATQVHLFFQFGSEDTVAVLLAKGHFRLHLLGENKLWSTLY